MKTAALIGLASLGGVVLGVVVGFSVAVTSMYEVYGNTSMKLGRLLADSADQLSRSDGKPKTVPEIVDSVVDLANLASVAAAQGYCSMDLAVRTQTQAASRRLETNGLVAAAGDKAGQISRRYVLATQPASPDCPDFRKP